jgi:hypothetical protein
MGESPYFHPRARVGTTKDTLRKRLYFLAPIGEDFFYFDKPMASARDEPRVLANL